MAASLPPNVSCLELAQDSDLVVVGTLSKIQGATGQLAIDEVLKGEVIGDVVTVKLTTHEVPQMGTRRFQEGETVVLFLKQGAIPTIMIDGWGARSFKPETKKATVDAVKYLLKLPHRSDKSAIAKEMLAQAVSGNYLLRSEAHWYIVAHLRDRENPRRYHDELVELLKHPETDVRWAALQALQFMRSPQALPIIIEITRGQDLRLVQAASMALGAYESHEAAAPLIALTKHPNPDLRIRALIDLDNSYFPESKAALVALLDDPDPQVRAMAPRGLVYWLRKGEANDIVPKLIAMLHDPVADVQVRAASMLGESGSVLAVGPLFGILRRRELGPELERAAMESLSQIYSRLEGRARSTTEENLITVISVLHRSHSYTAYAAVGFLVHVNTPESLTALRQAVQNHPEQNVRNYAKSLLPANPASSPKP